MGSLVLSLAGATLWNARYDPNKNSFMSFGDSTFLRGFWCIIVVLVHVPAAYQNRVQDMIGSFAFVGVTFFFMTSAYGLKWSLEHKEGYMDYFWRRRLPPILIPAVIANAFGVLFRWHDGFKISLLSFINIDNWVKVLLVYYLVFWAIYGIAPKIINSGPWQDVLICIIVVSFSLLDKFTVFHITQGWIVEPIGFAYGIIAAKYEEVLKKQIQNKWLVKCIVLAFLSGVFGISYLKNKNVLFFGDYLLKIALGISITAFIFEFISKVKVGNKVNSFLASISYQVYLLHRSVFILVGLLSRQLQSGIFIIVSIIITIVLSVGLKKLYEIMLLATRLPGGK